MTEAPVLVEERRGAAVWLTLARPGAANALSRALVRELGARLAAVEAQVSSSSASASSSEIRAVVLTGGSGRAFSAGADLKERLTMSRDDTRAYLDELGAALAALAALPVATIAAINGTALGGGLELALACDIRLAAEGVQMGLPEARLGIIPGAGGTQRLARAVGVARAKELILTGRRIDAATASAWGLVSRVVPAAELAAEVERVVEEVSACGPLAVAEAKAAIDGGAALPIGEGLALERRRYEVVLASADRDEGLRAFTEKRPPAFRGR